MPKCHPSPEVGRALEKFLGSGLPGANVNAIHDRIDTQPEMYDGSVSRNTIANFAKTHRATARVVNIIGTYLVNEAPGFEPEREMPPVPLNLLDFFGTTKRKRLQMASTLAGSFQTYARSTSRPGRIRRGLMEFEYDPRRQAMRVLETQHRQADESDPVAITIDWNGFAAQREDRIFCVMRTSVDHGSATPLFQVMEIAEANPTTGKVTALVARTMGIEELRKDHIPFSTVLLRRTYDGQLPKRDIMSVEAFRKICRQDDFLFDNQHLVDDGVM